MRAAGGQRVGTAGRLTWHGADRGPAAAGALDSGQDFGAARPDILLVPLGSRSRFNAVCLWRPFRSCHADSFRDCGGIELATSEGGGPAAGDDLSPCEPNRASGVRA